MAVLGGDRSVIADDGRIRLRRMRDTDITLVAQWLNAPHVKYWWDPDRSPYTIDDVVAMYGPHLEPGAATVACVIEAEGRPVGYLQFYPWSTEADYASKVELEYLDGEWGFDIFLGEPDATGHGVGSRTVDLLCAHLFEERGVPSVMLLSESTNFHAHRAYERVGFSHVGKIYDIDTRDGERVWSVVMRRYRAPRG